MGVIAIQRTVPIGGIGFMPHRSGGGSITITNNGASSVLTAYSFIAPVNPFSGTMRFMDLTVFISAATGNPKITPMLYSDNGGVPNALIEAGTESGVLGAGAWYTPTGFTTTSNLTAGTQYWVVFVCTSGTSCGVQYMASGGIYDIAIPSSSAAGAAQGWGMTQISSTDNGGTWGGTARPAILGTRFGITDGTDQAYWGFPNQAFGVATGATEKLYTNAGTAQEFGTQVIWPNVGSSVARITMDVRRVLAPAGSVRFRIYFGAAPALQATSYLIPPTNLGTASRTVRSALALPLAIPAGTVVTVTAGNSAADDSSNYFNTTKYTLHNDANSLALLPFAGMKSAKFTGGAWAYVTTEVVPFWLEPTSGAEFAAGGNVFVIDD